MNVTLQLPWPPSVNRYWRHIAKGPLAGRVLLSEDGRQYRKDCEHQVLMDRVPRNQLNGRLCVSIVARPPDRRARDLDNILKGVLDALHHCGVIRDDSDIDKLQIERIGVISGGSMQISISEIEGTANGQLFDQRQSA